VSELYLPVPHATHDELPAFDWYVPVPHAEHAADDTAPCVERYVPAAQFWQVDDKAIPVPVWYVPVPQAPHVELPELAWNVPAGHAKQAAVDANPVPL